MKRANELFGQNIESIDTNYVISSSYKCPYLNSTCTKQSRLIRYPLGTCSVKFNSSDVIICPSRFLQNETIFSDIAMTFFDTINNTVIFPEVGVTGIGKFDYVLVKHPPLKAIVEDFVIIEIQSDSTTGTGALVQNVRDVFEKGRFADNYKFGMNTYNTIKLSFIQMLMKGQLVEYWGKKIAWVMQDFVFGNMLSRFDLDRSNFDETLSSHFFLYEQLNAGQDFDIELVDVCSTNVKAMLKAFEMESGLPTLKSFVSTLETKLSLTLNSSNKLF